LFGLYHPQTARIIHNFGYLFIKQGCYRKAQLYLKLALRLREHLLPALHVSTAATLTFLAEVHLHLHQPDAAQHYAQRTHDMCLALFGDTHRMTAESHYVLGWGLYAQRKLDQARAQIERSLQINCSLPDGEGHVILFTLAVLGDVLADQGLYADARAHLERAIAGWEHAHAVDYPELVRPLTSLGCLLHRCGNTAGARMHLQRALRIGETKLGPTHPWTANVCAHLAALGD
jgi:Tfp pilus assembly protein PilF